MRHAEGLIGQHVAAMRHRLIVRKASSGSGSKLRPVESCRISKTRQINVLVQNKTNKALVSFTVKLALFVQIKKQSVGTRWLAIGCICYLQCWKTWGCLTYRQEVFLWKIVKPCCYFRNIYIYIYTHTHIHIHTHTHTHTHIYIYIYIHLYIHMHSVSLHIHSLSVGAEAKWLY